MKFRTEIDIAPWSTPLEYDDNIVCLGSCFATNIAQRLRKRKFNVVDSPTGILFNPASIAHAIESMNSAVNGVEGVDDAMMVELDGRYVNYAFHSSIAGATPLEATAAMQRALECGGDALKSCDLLIVTLGTAWSYVHRESGRVVANCHKQPARLFERRLLSVTEVVEALRRIVEGVDSRVLFTVSPVRHIGEGLEDNSLSKATLRVAVAEVVAKHGDRVAYFPAYEIMMDDLRDYRFYESDMAHPAQQAVDYIATKFFNAALSEQTKQRMQQVERVISAMEHRPFNPSGESYRTFCNKQLEVIASLHDVDLTEEKEFFERMLQINV
ncbi:MAG: GSCFA domain-containing protein [Alistipes sp.]|nr:GSCFA domain-containing protein [Alistipes sp.]